jgi:hypothetical protein
MDGEVDEDEEQFFKELASDFKQSDKGKGNRL